jgi:amino acid transporter
MSLLVCVSVMGNLSSLALNTPRVTFALAENRECPAVLGKLHPVYRTPAVSIALFGIVAVLLSTSGTFVWLATVSVIARLASYIATCLALPALRKKFTEPPRFRLPYGPAFAIAAVLLCGWLVTRAGSSDLRAFGIAAAAGALLYAVQRIKRRSMTQTLSEDRG